ncbi:MAG TPA: alpha/beta fold hydrolase, partial [Smithellaceae bacterium]|nr:alpha/beta fold hydrolase [Smithellaceae bacterium]
MAYFQSFDKTKLNYEFSPGRLPFTVIVLHGWGIVHIGLYRIFTKQLADFNLYMWDARNHGRSGIKENATIADLADDLRYFLTDIYPEKYPVIAIGHSMGALTLFEYISRYRTDRLAKIVIVDQSPKLMTDDE